MSKKITKEIFLKRFYKSFPEAEIEILKYTAITNPAVIKCCKCGKIHENKSANNFLKNYSCCTEAGVIRYERLQRIYAEINDYHLIKKVSPYDVIVHCDKCGNDIKRNIQSCLQSPTACKFCETSKQKNSLTKEEVQKRLDEQFYGTVELLTYNGQLKNNTYRCRRCNLIFKSSQINMQATRGCPKCDRQKSKGEAFIAHLLKDNNIDFKEQVQVKELPLQKFDFGVYENDEIKYYIEVQGEQHYQENSFFKTPLSIIQERDDRKREYCKKHNIPLYELIYKKGKFLNLDILPI